MEAIKFDHIIEIEETELADGTIIMREKAKPNKVLSAHYQSMMRSIALGLSFIPNKRELKLAEVRAMKAGIVGAY